MAAIHLRHALPHDSSNQPGRLVRNSPALAPKDAGAPPLFGLAPGGVCHAAPVTRRPVRSCRTLSPLPEPRFRERSSAVYSLWHFPWGHPRRALPATLASWSPDFPRWSASPNAAARPPDTTNIGALRPVDQPERTNPSHRQLRAIRRVPADSARSQHRWHHQPAARARTAKAVPPQRFPHRRRRQSNAPD